MLPLCLIASDAAEHAPQADALNRDFDRLGFRPYCVNGASAALGLMEQWQFDALLIDAHGQIEGWLQALPELRERCQAPIVLFSPDAGECRQLEALQSGATEVIVKPASAQLVAAKLHQLVDMARGRTVTVGDTRRSLVRVGALRLDPRRARASVGAASLPLTASEFELLLLLASRPGEFVHRDAIARTLGIAGEGRRSADTHVCRIRRKLRDAGAGGLRLATVYGRGYCLLLQEVSPASEAPGCAPRVA